MLQNDALQQWNAFRVSSYLITHYLVLSFNFHYVHLVTVTALVPTPAPGGAHDRFLYLRASGPHLLSFFFSFRFLLYRLPIDRASPSLLSVPVPLLPEPSHYLKLLFICPCSGR